jgi:hypothetical protein
MSEKLAKLAAHWPFSPLTLKDIARFGQPFTSALRQTHCTRKIEAIVGLALWLAPILHIDRR